MYAVMFAVEGVMSLGSKTHYGVLNKIVNYW